MSITINNATTMIGINLYRLTTRVKEMFADVLDAPNDAGEIDVDLVKTLSEVELRGEAEILDAACAVKELYAIDEALKSETERLKRRRDVLARQIGLFEGIIERVVTPGTKLCDSRASISWRKSTRTDVAVGAEELPKRYVRVKLEPDRTLIGAALKEGKAIDGCRLVEVNNLQIK